MSAPEPESRRSAASRIHRCGRALLTILGVALVGGCGGPSPDPEVPPPPEIRGFNFTHEGFGGRGGGYRSPEALASLDRLKSVGANAVAVVPYSFMRDPSGPSPLPLPRSDDGESDEGIATVIRAAQARGLQVMLKPQIWVRGAWPGAIEMETEADWSAFFDHYRRWIAHYARMAEAEGVPLFSVGVELVEATRHEAAWRDLVSTVRSRYSGQVVYSANWYEEFERIGFWDALDYVGVNVYFPLSASVDASDEDLAIGASNSLASVGRVANRVGQRVLITEAGFVTSAAPWIQPHASDERDLEISSEDQARAYAAFIPAAQSQEWLAGLLMWKWPSHGAPRGERPTFSPLGGGAEVILREWWTEEDDR